MKNDIPIDEYREVDTGPLQIGEGTSDVEKTSGRSSEPCHCKMGGIKKTARHHHQHVVGDKKRAGTKGQSAPGSDHPDIGPSQLIEEVPIV